MEKDEPDPEVRTPGPGSMKKLDSSVSSVIRRGQIITRLSDVVRELVDNAVDAGPTRIQVILDNYGLDKIEVRDDGHGISPTQINLAVTGGYTSKLPDEQNLSCGEDYGFRGEALSSICSFGNVVILTRTVKDPHATRYVLDEMGKIKSQHAAALDKGTNVIVRDLFVKYPVRRNYIREKSRMVAELKEVEFYLKSIGLANHKLSVVLIHNGSAIWTKPAVLSLDQAICSVLGVGISRLLVRCGPVTIPTPGTKNANDSLVTEIELHAPKVPIDTKLMTSSTNKSVWIIINRRRVHMKELEKVLHQHIMGAIPSVTQATFAKHPVTVLRIVTPPDQADFNREMDKSNLFLMYKVEILEKVEELLKEFYPIEITQTSTKEITPNVSTTGVSNVAVNDLVFDPPSSTVKMPSVEVRNKNIASFLSDIPASSNFSKSPVKTPTFPRGGILSPSSMPTNVIALPETILPSGFPPADSQGPVLRPAIAPSSSDVPAAPRTAAEIEFDRDWVHGRMKDQHGNIIESTTIVRGKAAFVGKSNSVSEFQRIVGTPTPTRDSLQSSVTGHRDPTLYPPSAAGSDKPDLFERLRTCHMTASSLEYPSYEQPPFKRSRSSSILSEPPERTAESIFPRRSSQTLTPRAPRQVTLDSLRNWKLPGSSFTRTNSIQSTPVPPVPRGIFSDDCSSVDGRIQRRAVPVTPQPSNTATATVLNKPSVSFKSPSLNQSTLHLNGSVPSSAMFKNLSLSDTPQIEERCELNKVIGVLQGHGTQVYIVQLEHLLGAFSPWNMLEMIPTMKQKIGIPAGCSESNYELSRECVKILINEFVGLTYDDYSEETVRKIFNILRDMDEPEDKQESV